MATHDDPAPIAPPLDPAPLTDTEVAALVRRVGVDTLGDIAAGAELGSRYAARGWARARVLATCSSSEFTDGGKTRKAAALAAYDEACGR
jgi:hypothetical protein